MNQDICVSRYDYYNFENLSRNIHCSHMKYNNLLIYHVKIAIIKLLIRLVSLKIMIPFKKVNSSFTCLFIKKTNNIA